MKRKYTNGNMPYKKRKYEAHTTSTSIANAAARRATAAAGETKYFDANLADTAIAGSTLTTWVGTEMDPAAPALDTLFVPSTGTDIINRIGRKVCVKALKMNITTTIPAIAAQTTARAAAVIRYILYQDMQTNGAQAQGEDVMGSTGTLTNITNDLQFMSLANLGRFKVLWDKRFVIQDPNFAGTGTADTYDGNGKKIVHKVRLKFPKGIIFNFKSSVTPSVVDLVDNSFHFLATVDNGALAPTVKYACRTSFKDM